MGVQRLRLLHEVRTYYNALWAFVSAAAEKGEYELVFMILLLLCPYHRNTVLLTISPIYLSHLLYPIIHAQCKPV